MLFTAKETHLGELLLEPEAYFFGSPQLGQILGLLGQLRILETGNSELRAENTVCHGGRRRTDFDQVQGVTLKQ